MFDILSGIKNFTSFCVLIEFTGVGRLSSRAIGSCVVVIMLSGFLRSSESGRSPMSDMLVVSLGHERFIKRLKGRVTL